MLANKLKMIRNELQYWLWKQRQALYFRRLATARRISWQLWLRFGKMPEELVEEIASIVPVAVKVSQATLHETANLSSDILLPLLYKLHNFGFSRIAHTEEQSRRGGHLVLQFDSRAYFFEWDFKQNLRFMRTDHKWFRNPRKDGHGYPLMYDFRGKLPPSSFPIEVSYHNYVGGMAGEGGVLVLHEDGTISRGLEQWIY
jgi:hypothetical protein